MELPLIPATPGVLLQRIKRLPLFWIAVLPWMTSVFIAVAVLQYHTGRLNGIATSIWQSNFFSSAVALLLLTCGIFWIVFVVRRAQKLADLQLKFVANISHELLTPIAVIHSVGQNLMDGLYDTRADSILSGSNITGQTRQLTDMVRKLLLFVSARNGAVRYTMLPLNVSHIIETVRGNVALHVENADFVIEQQVQVGLPNVMGDLPALSQCLQNLIVNAVKYSGKNRWIGISASIHNARTNQREVRISVRDHGCGIAGSDLRQIFEPFYRSQEAVDAQIHGTGLGLAVATQIAQAMGGRLSVASELEVGSTFTLHLPAMLSSEAETALLVLDSRQVRKHE